MPIVHNLDIDTWSYFEILFLMKDLKYSVTSGIKMWWKGKDVDYDSLFLFCDCFGYLAVGYFVFALDILALGYFVFALDV